MYGPEHTFKDSVKRRQFAKMPSGLQLETDRQLNRRRRFAKVYEKEDVTAKEAHLRHYKSTAMWNEHRLTILSNGNHNYILKYQRNVVYKMIRTISNTSYIYRDILHECINLFQNCFDIVKLLNWCLFYILVGMVTRSLLSQHLHNQGNIFVY